MKHLKKLGYLLILAVAFSFTACEEDSELLFIDNTNSEITFTNSFLSEYILTFETSSNLGERFTWNTPDFGLPTAISYDLQKSLTGDFSDYEVVGSTTGNEIAITIGDMLDYANDLGLDNDPGTEAPDTGTVSFRIRGYAGTDGVEVLSDPVALTLYLPEVAEGAVCEFDQLYGVGAGLTQTGWSWDNPPLFVCAGTGVYKANVHITKFETDVNDGNFRFFTAPSDWGSGRNYPWYADAGYTIDIRFENAMDDDDNFRFIGDTGQYLLTIDDANKVISLEDPAAIGVCEFDVLYTVGAAIEQTGWDWANPAEFWCDGNGVYTTYLELNQYVDGVNDGNFRFFTAASDWASGRNYPWYADAGYTIDDRFENAMDDDDNFRFTGETGFYFLSVDDVNKTITLFPSES